MTEGITRRSFSTMAMLAAIPQFAVPSGAEGETDAVFTDYPKTFNANNPNSTTKLLDIRTLDGLITPSDQFFSIQHHNQPEIDGAAHRVKFTGLVKKETELSLADLKKMKATDVVAGYECSATARAGCRRFLPAASLRA